MESHHRVFRNKQFRESSLQRQLHFFAQQKVLIRHAISHLNKILNREIGNRVGTDLSRPFKLSEHSFPVRTMPVEQFKKDGAIFKTTINSLPKEWNNRMRRVAEHQSPTFYMPWRTLDGHHRACRIGKKILFQM